MNILMVGADQTNATDGVIVQGIKEILYDSIGEYRFTYLLIDDHNEQSIPEHILKDSYDVLLVCGTPWLWDNFHATAKFRNLIKIKEFCNWKKGILFGIGSAFCLKDKDTNLRDPLYKDQLEKMTENMRVIVRDTVAAKVLETHGIDHVFLPCPAYFCYGADLETTSKRDNVIIYYSIGNGVAQVCCDQDYRQEFKQRYLDFYEKYPDSKIYCAQEIEVLECFELLGKSPKVLRSWAETLTVMENAENVISGRVHCAVPAIIQGANVEFLAVDTRSSVIYDVLADDVRFNYEIYLENYKTEILTVLGKTRGGN